MTRSTIARPLRAMMVLAAGLVMASALSGCIVLGGGSPPSKTYIVVPPGSSAPNAPPASQ
ncbi:hypothetical protein AruPA_05230 [Acidiphilium sp. PA]|uniref:hypothetical protein n=1 Tax=Acidiphilium sp. PA TaxID=2871705 RepID=UPI002244C6A6|nr:hypothetical protein [Acidiphilium sp. PA]MCW8306431.1 hypothetical protein [Acidiphilium sp. PA]